MATVEESTPGAAEKQPAAFPDYMTDPNAVLKDVDAEWRYGRPPDYSKTRKYYAEILRGLVAFINYAHTNTNTHAHPHSQHTLRNTTTQPANR
ncbi:hypothetical protein EKO27_g11780 [Xylaria grammica]|uniref:Uncharacterized protein n=1 Tax=Xylaria grammica TaxID=363999 RepID=A0A439CMD5_9PEZI|nr:hypothetical protein EKO27_g11780 [Xylaria grammica]